jgi:predicted regulator of Ras-like GTPase activity (Roadblock/LC7/MglB family)
VLSVLPAGTDEDRVSAMAAALLSLGERTSQELQRGTLEQVYVKGGAGYILLMQAGNEACSRRSPARRPSSAWCCST